MRKSLPWSARWGRLPQMPLGCRTRPGSPLAAGALAVSLSLILLLGSAGCARNPVTGRPEAVLTSEKGEIEQGKQAARLVQEEIGLVEDPDTYPISPKTKLRKSVTLKRLEIRASSSWDTTSS